VKLNISEIGVQAEWEVITGEFGDAERRSELLQKFLNIRLDPTGAQ
jgi:hypothetical protein